MKRIYANLLGVWTDITETGTVEDHQDPTLYFKENLTEDFTKYDYIHVQHDDKDYLIHLSMIQIVTE